MVREVLLRSHPMECLHTTRSYHSGALRPSPKNPPWTTRVPDEAWENTLPTMKEQGMWSCVGQRTSRWVGLTCKVNCLWVFFFASSCLQPWIASKCQALSYLRRLIVLKLMGMTQQFYITIIFACCTQRYKSMSISCMVQEILSHKINNAYRTMNHEHGLLQCLTTPNDRRWKVCCFMWSSSFVLLFFCSLSSHA